MTLLENTNTWKNDFQWEIEKITNCCIISESFAKTPPKPVVNWPPAKHFDKKSFHDLKSWGDIWSLHLPDVLSTLTISSFVYRKKSRCILNAILLHWVGSGYGVIKCFNWHPRRVQCWWNQEVANKLYVGIYTTATHSPFQNGLCKYIYAVTNSMLTNQIS